MKTIFMIIFLALAYTNSVFAEKIKNFKTVIKGDQKIKCISAASIVAKVFRDLYMIKLGNKFPQYNWQKNFGYGTSQHLKAIKKLGITKHHRVTFNPIISYK